MYESPIRLIKSETSVDLDSKILKVVQRCGIDVNKEELIKAIQNDRQQYEKGYADAKEEYMPRWIPCSSGNLPQTTDPVNITWVNRDPPSYYSFIKDIPFTATGHYHNGKWWWYSATCKDYLDESGESEVDRVDDRIEILAWQPLPDPYWGENHE